MKSASGTGGQKAYIRYLMVIGGGGKAEYDFSILKEADDLAFGVRNRIKIFVQIQEFWGKQKAPSPVFQTMVKEALAREGVPVELGSSASSAHLPIHIKGWVRTSYWGQGSLVNAAVYKTDDDFKMVCFNKELYSSTAGAHKGRAKGMAPQHNRAQERAMRSRAGQVIKGILVALDQFFPYLRNKSED